LAVAIAFFDGRGYLSDTWELKLNVLVLDRDGVINYDSDSYIKSVSEWIPIEGSIEAVAEFSRAGFRIVVVTNQSGLGRGLLKETILEDIHSKLESKVESLGGKIDGIFFCPHHPKKNCECRKPKIGLLKKAEHSLQASLKNSFFVGDSYTDLQCAVNFGLTPILVRSGKGPITESRLHQEREAEVLRLKSGGMPNQNFNLYDTAVYNDLAHFSRFVLP
jgi:D-glycero-D-manno-heptose 1,7-bisphosphate phosphatase